MLTLASAGTFLHTGLKLPYYMFFGKDSGARGKEPPTNMLVAMGLAAAACVLIGVFPGLLYERTSKPVDYVPYTVQHVRAHWDVGLHRAGFLSPALSTSTPSRTISLDTDWFYRRGSARLVRVLPGPLARLEYGFVGEIYELCDSAARVGRAEGFSQTRQLVVDSAMVGVGRSTQTVSQV